MFEFIFHALLRLGNEKLMLKGAENRQVSCKKVKLNKNPFSSDDMWKGASPRIFANAQKLRESATEAEEFLWLALRENQLEGLKFRRQHPLSIYRADFYSI
jgi:hypothetical protein